MYLFLLLKSDNRIDNQLKVSFLRKKWMKPVGKSLPPKQRKVVFVSPKVLLFTQTSRSWSWGSPRQVLWIGGGLSVEDLPTTLTGRPQPEPQSDLDTYNIPKPAVSTLEPNSPWLKLTQIKTRPLSLCWPAREQHQHLWLKDSCFVPPTPSCTICPLRRAGRGEGHPSGPSPTPPQPRGKSSEQGVVLTARGGGEGPWSRLSSIR